MASMLALGMSFLLYFVTVGMMWLIGANVVAQVVEGLPGVPPAWQETHDTNVENIKLIVTFLPGILLLFACIKMAINASNRGAD